MKLFQTIDALLIGTRYLSWGIALVGIPLSALLLFANLTFGLPSALVFVAALLLAIGVTLLLLPRPLAKDPLAKVKQRAIVGTAALVLATAVMGMVYWSVGDFPALNLLVI